MGGLLDGYRYTAGPSNAEIARGYLDWQRDVRRRTAITVYQYAAKLESFLEHVGTTPLERVTVDEMNAWLQRPREGRGHGGQGSAATVQKEVAILRGMYKHAIAREWLTADPTVLLHSPTPKNANPRPVPDHLWTPIWAAENLAAEARVVFGLGYFCGLRRAEITALRGTHVDAARERLVGFKRKGGGDDVLDYGELLGIVADDLPALLPGGPDSFLRPLHEAVERAAGGLLLNWRLTGSYAQALNGAPAGVNDPQHIYKRIKRWMRDIGRDVTFTPHQLRHSFVTNLLRAGVPVHLVSMLANHSSVAVTMRYAKLGGQDVREWRQRRQQGRLRGAAEYPRGGQNRDR